ncbi:hypothetical protein E3N88_00024 [Mikania micrantha]|uniref:Uncharacterized protein n=1 Tax=Mikania micrantha TaxID=192012 RepID=A0A5N6PZ02_9ASTR|nr:hypothetical protein E3N88_00024 [Mikania micrantha]
MLRVDRIANRLNPPDKLGEIHPTFHVSHLRKCLADDVGYMPLNDIEVDEILNYIEEPVAIVDTKEKQLLNKTIRQIKRQALVTYSQSQTEAKGVATLATLQAAYASSQSSTMQTNSSQATPALLQAARASHIVNIMQFNTLMSISTAYLRSTEAWKCWTYPFRNGSTSRKSATATGEQRRRRSERQQARSKGLAEGLGWSNRGLMEECRRALVLYWWLCNN